jgi:hypothetical protein
LNSITLRLGRIKVTGVQNQSKWALKIETTNVLAFQLPVKVLSMRLDGQMSATIDGLEVNLSQRASSQLIMMRSEEKDWKSVEQSFWHNFSHGKRRSPLIQILTSTGPMKIIYGTKNQKRCSHLRSVATRLAHMLFVYFRMAVIISSDQEALVDQRRDYGNLVIIGNTLDNCYFTRHADHTSAGIKWIAGTDDRALFSVGNHEFDEPGQGV